MLIAGCSLLVAKTVDLVTEAKHRNMVAASKLRGRYVASQRRTQQISDPSFLGASVWAKKGRCRQGVNRLLEKAYSRILQNHQTVTESSDHTASENVSGSLVQNSKMCMIDSEPMSYEFFRMYWFMKTRFDIVVTKAYGDRQISVECGYIATHGAFCLKRDLEWKPERILNGDHIGFVCLFNTIINQKPLDTPISLCSLHIQAIVAALEFLEENFEVNVADDPSLALDIYNHVMRLKFILENPAPDEDMRNALPIVINSLKGAARPEKMFWRQLGLVAQFLTESVPQRGVRDTFYEGIVPLQKPACPGWVGIFEPKQFIDHIWEAVSSERREDMKKIVIINTCDYPDGRHWYTLWYLLPKIPMRVAPFRAFVESSSS